MEISIPTAKVKKVIATCREMLHRIQLSVRELTQLLGFLMSTMLAVVPVLLHFRFLQMDANKALVVGKLYKTHLTISHRAREEFLWLIKSLETSNGRSLLTNVTEIIIMSDASNHGANNRK